MFQGVPTPIIRSSTALAASGFYRWSVVLAVLLVVVGPVAIGTGPTMTNSTVTAMFQR
jgi:hypothetical protein